MLQWGKKKKRSAANIYICMQATLKLEFSKCKAGRIRFHVATLAGLFIDKCTLNDTQSKHTDVGI